MMKKKIGIFVCCIMTITTALGAFTAYADGETDSATATAESKPKKEKGKKTLAKITAVSDNSITVLKAQMPEPPAKPEGDDSTTEKTRPAKPEGDDSTTEKTRPAKPEGDDSTTERTKPAKPESDDDSTEKTKPEKPDNSEFLSKLTFEEEMTIDISDSSIIDEDLGELKEGSIISICYDSDGNIKKITSGNKPHHKDGEKSPKDKKSEESEETTISA